MGYLDNNGLARLWSHIKQYVKNYVTGNLFCHTASGQGIIDANNTPNGRPDSLKIYGRCWPNDTSISNVVVWSAKTDGNIFNPDAFNYKIKYKLQNGTDAENYGFFFKPARDTYYAYMDETGGITTTQSGMSVNAYKININNMTCTSSAQYVANNTTNVVRKLDAGTWYVIVHNRNTDATYEQANRLVREHLMLVPGNIAPTHYIPPSILSSIDLTGTTKPFVLRSASDDENGWVTDQVDVADGVIHRRVGQNGVIPETTENLSDYGIAPKALQMSHPDTTIVNSQGTVLEMTYWQFSKNQYTIDDIIAALPDGSEVSY